MCVCVGWPDSAAYRQPSREARYRAAVVAARSGAWLHHHVWIHTVAPGSPRGPQRRGFYTAGPGRFTKHHYQGLSHVHLFSPKVKEKCE